MPEANGKICAVVAERTVKTALSVMEEASDKADMIELRLDYLRDFHFGEPENLSVLLANKARPTIITCRAVSEGGDQHIEDATRLRLLSEGTRYGADFCDIEAAYFDQARRFSPDTSKLILSYHNFNETPPDLDAVYEQITSLPAAVHKMVVRAKSLTDTLAIFRLLRRARQERRNLIALAMGESGLITRILGPSFGSYLTFCPVHTDRSTAPGQLACATLQNLYQTSRISPDTAITGIIGHPVAHSASPAIHNAAFHSLGINFTYLPFDVEDISDFFAHFIRPVTHELGWRLRGFSVTIPHKVSVINCLDHLDPIAEAVGAVNTVVMDGNSLIGYNTDVEGALLPLERACELAGARCAVIGSGGAARALIYGLTGRGAQVRVFARDEGKGRALAEEFGAAFQPLESLPAYACDVIINATPAGMKGHQESASPVPRRVFVNRPVAYDLVYNPLLTPFLEDAREEGCYIINGLEMLVAQATLQFKLWTGREAPAEIMQAAALEALIST